MKTLMLVSGGLQRETKEEMARLAAADKFPRVLVFEQTMNADLLSPESLVNAPRTLRLFYRFLPAAVAQAFEAYRIRKRYDAILSWSERPAIAYALVAKIFRAKTPHIPLLYWMSKPKQAFLLRFTRSHMHCVITWSSVQREHAIRHLGFAPERIVLVRHPVDTRFYRPFPGDGDMICAVGSENRDYATLIEALRTLPIRCHIAAGNIRLVSSNSAETITTDRLGSLPPNVTIGFKKYGELRELYMRSRFAVVPLQPSDTDNGITSILEAMAMGKAVLCSRTEGQVDAITEGVTGFFVEQGNPEKLRQAILRLWNDPALTAQIGAAARLHVERYHDIEMFANNVLAVVNAVVSGDAIPAFTATAEPAVTPAALH